MKRTFTRQHITRAAMTLLVTMLTAATAWADDVTLQDDNGTKYVNMPTTGKNTLTLSDATITTFKVYDDGGASSNYSNSCNGTLTLTAPEGYVLQLSGSITMEFYWDKLTVYDGSTTSGTKLLDAVSSTTSDTKTAITTVYSSGQSLTLYFYSDGGTNYTGLDLTVTLISTSTVSGITVNNPATGGSVTATVGGTSATTAKVNDVVTLTATPESGYVLSGISVTDASSNAVAVDWSIWSNTATFRMPASAVTVTTTFSNDPSINMPATDTKSVTIPTSVPSFKVYDDGGKKGYYSYSCHGTLTLTAPTGYVLQLSGSITTDTNDNLTVYDNSEASGTKLLDAVSSTSSDTKTAIPTVISSGQSMTLYFYSNNYPNSAGLDLTVTLVDANTEYDITVSTTTGGSVAASPTPAKAGQTVTLTATPESGYVLSGISVTDASAVTWDGLFFNTATFRMPASAVTVTPTFTNDLTSANLSINMPMTGTKTATIPSGVTSFKVYDDGGASGNYSNSCSGTLTLTAPEGYVLQLSGNITTDSGFDKLTVCDGSTTSGTKLLDAVSSTSSNIQTAITTVTSSGQSMTLYFSSDKGGNYAGLDLTVTLVDPNVQYNINGLGATTGGSVTADKSKAKVNETVTLTATPTDATYLLSDLTVVDANSNAVAVDWSIWSNTATFTMPSSVVTVTPTFTNDLTSLYINMPATDTKSVTIPSDVTSFKVYDDGGASGNYYSNNCRSTLTLTAPEGYVLQLSGSITTEKDYDKLTVYDNNAASGTKLLDAVSSTSSGTRTDITTVTSSGQSMTLYFYSDISGNYAGLDLTVDVFKPLELANYADNTDAIKNNNNGMMSKVTLSDRTLLKNGDWNTLCLPFSLTAEQIAASPLAGATIKELLSTSNLDSEGKLTLNFKDATAITAGKPYMVKWDNTPVLTISSADDWNTFASNVNNGTESYEGKVVKLSADISVSNMVGTVTSGDAPENAFKGIFDGGGHTITVNINSTDRHGTAPFRYIKDATIMDVRTAGTVTGTMHCAGLVGLSEGTSYIKNCEVNVAVNCSGTSHSHCGGILGHGKSSTTTVSDCLFSGSISNATTAAGIIYGWGDNGTHTIVNCLAAGTYTGCSGVDLLKKYEGTEVITNCYKTENVGSQGTYTTATGDELVALLGDGWVNNGGSVVPKRGVLTNPVFKNVTIDNTVNDVSFSGGSFKGTYAPLEITEANRDVVLLLATGNKLGYAKTDRTVANGKALGTCRAYFEITGAAAVRSFIMDFGDDDNTTGIIEAGANSQLSTLNSQLSTWYTLDGRRLQGKPAQKGVYIQNGKKVIIK